MMPVLGFRPWPGARCSLPLSRPVPVWTLSRRIMRPRPQASSPSGVRLSACQGKVQREGWPAPLPRCASRFLGS